MRITNSMMINQFLSESNEALNRVSKYQSQVDSTKKISGIADDPQATLLSLKARDKLTNLAVYQNNITTASNYLKESESSVDELNEILKSAYEDIVNANSGSKTQNDLNVIAQDIDNLKNEVLNIGNTSLGSVYIFGGYNSTGSVSGSTKTPPFSSSSVSGDLNYNGINLSQLSWKEDFDGDIKQMTSLQTDILSQASAINMSDSDSNLRDQFEKMGKSMGTLVDSGKRALASAKEFGIDSNSPEYKALSNFVTSFSAITDQMNSETVKDVAGDHILDTDPSIVKNSDGTINYDYYSAKGISVYTADEFANKFTPATAQGYMNAAVALLTDTGSGSQMDQAATTLGSVVTIPASVQTAVTNESNKQTRLQIGSSQTVNITITGLELMGTGSSNIYHLLDKCEKVLKGDSGYGTLSEMVTALQDSQSDVLNLQTRIGSTEDRLNLISDRYVASNINYKQMQSDAEDVDMAEAITNFTTAKTVYSAALQAGANMVQTSLINFLK